MNAFLPRTSLRFVLLTLLIWSGAHPLSAQLRTYLGVDVGPKWEVYRFEDQGEGVYTRPFFHAPIVSVNVGQDVHPNFRLETGFSYVQYGASYRFRNTQSRGIYSAATTYQVPLRVKARFGLGSSENFRIMPTLGYVLGINENYSSSGTGNFLFTGPSGVLFSQDTSRYDLQRIFHLLQTGLTLEFQIRQGPIIALGGSYFTGLKRLIDVDVSYSINGSPITHADVYSNGNYFTFTLGFYYPISRIWSDKKTERDWER